MMMFELVLKSFNRIKDQVGFNSMYLQLPAPHLSKQVYHVTPLNVGVLFDQPFGKGSHVKAALFFRPKKEKQTTSEKLQAIWDQISFFFFLFLFWSCVPFKMSSSPEVLLSFVFQINALVLFEGALSTKIKIKFRIIKRHFSFSSPSDHKGACYRINAVILLTNML